ncbi:MAG: DUF4136 domain-containing protein [Candidatus Eisenbacteria sp.]|nr:DUF4136 domain-containing protein [Candidatus Eisenbacteria bacterium]
MRASKCLWLLAVALMIPACSRMNVHVQVDPNADFTAYRTFDFLKNGGMKNLHKPVPPRMRIIKDPLFHAYVQEAIEEEFTQRSLVRVRDRGQADLLVGYRTVVRDQADVVPPIHGVGWRGHLYVARPGHVRWYKEGTLVVDVIDARTDNLIWRGIGTGAMRDMRPGEDLKASVREILEKFPLE